MKTFKQSLADRQFQTLLVHIEESDLGQVLWIEFNRHAAFNAISMEMLEELHAILDLLQHPQSMLTLFSPHHHPRVIIITSSSTSKAFCSGVDIKAADRGIGGAAWNYKDMRSQQLLARMIEKLRHIPQPIIAAIHGPAAGAGLAIALAADIRIASSRSSFSAAFVKLGLTGTDMGTSFFFPRIAGLGIASEALLTGRPITAQRAFQIGMVNEIVQDSTIGSSAAMNHTDTTSYTHTVMSLLRKSAQAMAFDMLKCSPVGLQLTKEQLNAVSDNMSLRAAMTAENSHQLLLVRDEVSSKIATQWLDKMVKGSASVRRSKL